MKYIPVAMREHLPSHPSMRRYRALTSPPRQLSDMLQPGQTKFDRVTVTRDFIDTNKDLAVRVHVEKGSARRVRQTPQPQGNEDTRAIPHLDPDTEIWATEKDCACPNPPRATTATRTD